MEWLEALYGTVVGLDTAPLIYFIEKHPAYLSLTLPFFEAVERGDIQIVTSTITLTEVLVHPYRQGNRNLAQQYSTILLHARNLQLFPVSPEIADEAARLRSIHGFKTPDAIQIAAATSGAATAFLTNDAELVNIPGLKMLVLDQLLP